VDPLRYLGDEPSSGFIRREREDEVWKRLSAHVPWLKAPPPTKTEIKARERREREEKRPDVYPEWVACGGCLGSEKTHTFRDDCLQDATFRKVQHKKANGFVYFIQGGDLVKIGYTTNIRQRLYDLQTSAPIDLVLLGLIPGTRALEKEYHKRFAAHRVRGEWFSAVVVDECPEVFQMTLDMAA
jgi:hypothetical protein